MAQSVLPRTTPLLLFTLFPLMPTAVPRDPEKKVTFWLCCKGYFGKKPCREAHKVTLPYNQLGMTEFEDLRDQITQHVLDKHWPTGNPDSIKDSYEFGDLECWDKWDKNTQYVLPEPKQVTPGTSSSPEPEARRSRSPKQSRRRSIVQEHGSFFFFLPRPKVFFFFPNQSTDGVRGAVTVRARALAVGTLMARAMAVRARTLTVRAGTPAVRQRRGLKICQNTLVQ